MSDLETLTYDELDELVGSTFYLGRVLNAAHNFLMVTGDQRDARMVELMNNGPTELVVEILPAMAVLLREMHSRVADYETAVSAAIDSLDDRIESEDEKSRFDKIMKGFK